ncbi:MAG: hypothetical protein PHE73_08675 [Sulfurovaceae bacterium]|nr:hypothetical protein [Sulfurovaceae bacterium]
MKIILGIIIGIILVLTIKSVYAENKIWEINTLWSTRVEKIQDGNINCYVLVSSSNSYGKISYNYGAISCIKIK